MITLREACIARGINPDAPGYRTPSSRMSFTALDRLIPGVPDWKPVPYELTRNPRRQYTPDAAARHRNQIERDGIEAYVALFNQLNNLKG